MVFTAGQRLTAALLNSAFAAVPQKLDSQILTISAASITISIPAGYNHVQCIWTGRQDSGSGGAFATVRLNGDSGTNYTHQKLYGNLTTATSANSGATTGIQVGVIPGSGDTANYFGSGAFIVGNIASTSVFKAISAGFGAAVTATNGYAGTDGGLWASTAAVTSVTLLPNTGNLVAGSSMAVYGWV